MLVILYMIVLFGLVPDENKNSNLHPPSCGNAEKALRTSVCRGDALEIQMKEIPLTNSSLKALVDDGYFSCLPSFSWSLNKGYVCSNIQKGKSLHLIIMGYKKNRIVDHVNRNALDNRRCNLRFVTKSQSVWNTGKKKTKSHSKFKGVTFHKRDSVWVAQICFKYKNMWLGTFSTEGEAAKSYDTAAIKLFGNFACTNKMLGLL